MKARWEVLEGIDVLQYPLTGLLDIPDTFEDLPFTLPHRNLDLDGTVFTDIISSVGNMGKVLEEGK